MEKVIHYKRTKKAKLKRVGGSIAIYVGEQKAIHVLNRTAHFVYECMENPVTFDELVFLFLSVLCKL